MRRLRPFPAIRCASGFLDEGPHSGCAEFEPPRWHDCRTPATHKAKLPAALDPYYQGPETIKVCAFHTEEVRRLAGVRVYRFRRI